MMVTDEESVEVAMLRKALREANERIDNLQRSCTALENDRRLQRARAENALRYLQMSTVELPLSVLGSGQYELVSELRLKMSAEAERTDAILKDAWSGCAEACRAYVKAMKEADCENAEAADLEAMLRSWDSRFRTLLGITDE